MLPSLFAGRDIGEYIRRSYCPAFGASHPVSSRTRLRCPPFELCFFMPEMVYALSVGKCCPAFGASPPTISLIYALPKISPQDCFYLRFFARLEPRHGRLRFPPSPLVGQMIIAGSTLTVLPAIINGGTDVCKDEHSSIGLLSAFRAARISSNGMFSFVSGFFAVLKMILK